MIEVVGSSKGKIILSGEHSVVYGHAALALPAFLSTEVEVGGEKTSDLSPALVSIIQCISSSYPDLEVPTNIRIINSLPQNAGLGSSAALSHAVLNALSLFNNIEFTNPEKFTLIQECERVFHSTPSGIDAATVVLEKPLKFEIRDNQSAIELLPLEIEIPPHVLINSGSAQESTREMVGLVRKNPEKEFVFRQMASLTAEIEQGLRDGNLDLRLISESEILLERLGIVGEKAHKIITTLEHKGASAKIVGAGGRIAGSGTILAFHSDMKHLLKIVEDEGLEIYQNGRTKI